MSFFFVFVFVFSTPAEVPPVAGTIVYIQYSAFHVGVVLSFVCSSLLTSAI